MRTSFDAAQVHDSESSKLSRERHVDGKRATEFMQGELKNAQYPVKCKDVH